MSSYERFLECDYLDAQLQPASLMLRKCVQDPSVGYNMSCTDENKYLHGQGTLKEPRADVGLGKYNMMDTLAIQRGHEVGIESEDTRELRSRQKSRGNPMIEGYENYAPDMFITDNGPGASRVPEGECPEGYSRCKKTGACLQVCTGCKYKDNMKSQIFNEADPCFPNGVYDGVDNEGNTKCTCGPKNTYCPKTFVNSFGAEGTYMYGKGYRTDIGVLDAVSRFFHL